MFIELVKNMTAQDRAALAELGVPSSRVSDWKTGLRFPTRPQALALATLKGLNFSELEKELTALEIAKDAEKNEGFAKLMTKLKGAWHFT